MTCPIDLPKQQLATANIKQAGKYPSSTCRERHTMDNAPVNDSLFIIWSSPDSEVADNLVFMYSHNALKKLWWGRVRLIIWGPSAKLVASNERIQQRLAKMIADGMEVWACRACTDSYGVTEELEKAGINVHHVGQSTTDMLKQGWSHLTF